MLLASVRTAASMIGGCHRAGLAARPRLPGETRIGQAGPTRATAPTRAVPARAFLA